MDLRLFVGCMSNILWYIHFQYFNDCQAHKTAKTKKKLKEGEVEKPHTPASRSDTKQARLKCNSVINICRKKVLLSVSIRASEFLSDPGCWASLWVSIECFLLYHALQGLDILFKIGLTCNPRTLALKMKDLRKNHDMELIQMDWSKVYSVASHLLPSLPPRPTSWIYSSTFDGGGGGA